MGNAQRIKGATGERELTKIFLQNGIETAHRGYVQFRQADVVGLPGIHIEVKRVEGLTIGTQLLTNAVKQAVAESKKKNGGTPAVFHRVNRGKWFVTMRETDFLETWFFMDLVAWDYLHKENGLLTARLDEWLPRYKQLLDYEKEVSNAK